MSFFQEVIDVWKETSESLQCLTGEEEEACEFLEPVITAGPDSLSRVPINAQNNAMREFRWHTMLQK